MSKPQSISPPTVGIVFATLVVLWVILGFIAPSWVADSASEQGQIGDQFGAVNALFSGLALGGVLLTILQQRVEIQQMADHIKGLEEDQEQSRAVAVLSSRVQAHAAIAQTWAAISYMSGEAGTEVQKLQKLEEELRKLGD